MSKVYMYKSSGYYAGEDDFYGVMPNNSTKISPTLKEGFIPRWTGDKWEQVEDHKGESGYLDGKPHIIKEYGPLPDGWGDTPPPPPLPTQNELIASFMAAIQARLDAFARTRSYDDARACVSVYLGCSNETFAAEAEYMQGRIVASWEWGNAYANAVLRGESQMPESIEAFVAELEAAVPLVWPVPDTRVTAQIEPADG